LSFGIAWGAADVGNHRVVRVVRGDGDSRAPDDAVIGADRTKAGALKSRRLDAHPLELHDLGGGWLRERGRAGEQCDSDSRKPHRSLPTNSWRRIQALVPQ